MNRKNILRHPEPEDKTATFALMTRCDMHEFGEPDSELEDLTNDWNNINLKEDAWLSLTPENEVIGYAAVLPWAGGYRFDLYADPTHEDDEIIQALLASCQERSMRLAREQKKERGTRAKCYVTDSNLIASQVLKEMGFQRTKYVYNMQARMEAPPTAVKFPEGIAIRNHIPGEDDRQVHEFIQTAFERPGRTRQPFESWKSFMLREDIFKPELWFLAMKGDELIGACLCYEYSDTDRGWVRQLGVLESVRRSGLGSALLQHAFAEFYRRGYKKVGLAVESDNPRAIRFYENVGMEQTRCYVEYSRQITG